MLDPDAIFFQTWPDRQSRIRMPEPYNECAAQFHELGDHPRHRRRILIWRVPPNNPIYNPAKPQLMKIPFLAFADETIEDRDDVVLPIIDRIMAEAASTGGR